MKAEKNEVIRLLNTAKGQIEGIIKMINSDEYCINISNQIMATTAILKRINLEVLQGHLNHCVLNAQTQETKEEKLNEIYEVMKKIIR